MGYTTEFHGSITIEPPLSKEEITYIRIFSSSRRMDRKKGPFYADDSEYGFFLDSKFKNVETTDIIDNNKPPAGQPSLWCQWTCNDEGTAIEWDGGEKFYSAPEWLSYLRTYFLTRCAAKDLSPETMGFLQTHRLAGEIHAVGESSTTDIWKLKADDFGIYVSRGTWSDRALIELRTGDKDKEVDNDNDDFVDAGHAIDFASRACYVTWEAWEKVPDFHNPAEEAHVLAITEKRILDAAAESPQTLPKISPSL